MADGVTENRPIVDDPDGPGAFWDAKYQDDAYFYGTEPNAWLTRQRHRLPDGGQVLSVADGEGRNGVWLAGQGMKVTSVDASGRAQAKASALALKRGVALTQVTADLTTWDWPTGKFDAVVAIFAHFRRDQRPSIHRNMLAACKPGGLVLLEAFSPYQRIYGTGGPKDIDMLYTAQRLREDFADAEILEVAEVEVELDEGPGHRGPSAVAHIVARRRP